MPTLSRRRAGLVAALACLAAPAAASAEEVVTAENLEPDPAPAPYSSPVSARGLFTDDRVAAQTFTAQATGALERIDVLVTRSPSANADLRVSLLEVGDDGRPVGLPPQDEIAGESEPVGDSSQELRTVEFANGPRLVAGRRYAVGLSTESWWGPWNWRFALPYAGGEAFWARQGGAWETWPFWGTMQFAFRVVVDSPYDFGGFRPPLGGGDAVTTVRAGRAVPVRFSLGGVATATLSSATSRPIRCGGAAAGEPVAGATPADGPRGLVYDAAADEYSFVWKTEAAWAGTCREFALTLDDGVARTAVFRFAR